jgi:hypothetical protein
MRVQDKVDICKDAVGKSEEPSLRGKVSADARRLAACCVIPVQPPNRDQRGDGGEQEQPGQNPFLHVPLQQLGEVVEHVGGEREGETVAPPGRR